MKRIAVAGLLACLSAPAVAQQQSGPVMLDGLFQDHAVFQRGQPIPIWGRALPGEAVTLNFAGATVEATADRSGKWSATLPAHDAGGPFELIASTARGARQTIGDILIGDVFLCSGQSNMEFEVSRALNGWGETHGAGDDSIRLLTVGKDTSLTPLNAFKLPVRWQAASPDSVGDFSAVCYFLGRDLRARQKVPIGLIDDSWGGTAIDAWRSQAAIEKGGGAADKLAVLRAYARDPAEGNRLWGEIWERWWKSRNADEPWRPGSAGAWKPVPTLTPWESWGDPALAGFDGMVWYRTSFTLTPEQAAKPATVSVGWVDEVDQTWVNGVAVGNSYGPGSNRVYEIPAGTLKPGTNEVVINALDTWASGGLTGPENLRAIHLAGGGEIPLTGKWEYRAVPASIGQPPRAPWETNAGLSGIYNGMVAPLGRYALKGVAWYQGESDAGAAQGYAGKLTSMMNDWRAQFGDPDLPFLIVQLAGWGPAPAHPVESGFARIRDEQRRAVAADPNAALAVAIDVGDRADIHPANKQEVAHRLARAARHAVYGEPITPSGPEVAGAQRKDGRIRVEFVNADGGLVTYSSNAPIGFELCGAEPASCRFVPAELAGNSVLLTPGAGPATRVRFCWGDSPMCNLYDKAGLPAGPFEVEVR